MKNVGLTGLVVASLSGLAACQTPQPQRRVAVVTLTEHLPGGGYATTTRLPPPGAKPELLSQGEAICRLLNLADLPAKGCSARTVLGMAQKQTDPRLWFTNIETRSYGSPATCLGSTPLERFKVPGQADLIDYLCLAPHNDDKITESELLAYEALARRLGAIEHPTLSEFGRAHYMKVTIDTYARMAIDPLK